MILHHENNTYRVKYSADSPSDMDVWLVNVDTDEVEDLFNFPQSVQDRAWDLALSDYMDEEGHEGIYSNEEPEETGCTD
jgi:hypothetical protein